MGGHSVKHRIPAPSKRYRLCIHVFFLLGRRKEDYQDPHDLHRQEGSPYRRDHLQQAMEGAPGRAARQGPRHRHASRRLLDAQHRSFPPASGGDG